MTTVDATTARKVHRTLEPVHGMIYFVPEAQEEYSALGVTSRRAGYFGSRAAAMGPVGPSVVVATFFNFWPGLVERAVPSVWRQAAPEQLLAARLTAADRALRRMLGDAVDSPEMAEAAELARLAAQGCHVHGRPLYAGHADLPWPTAPHLVLWHAQTLLREFRGDGHIAAMTTQGLTGVEALVVHEATGDLAPGVLQATRAWPDDAWEAGRESVRARGWLADDGGLTDAGKLARQEVEDTTDLLTLPCWAPLGDDGCRRLRELVRPFSKTIAAVAFAGGLRVDDE